MHLYAAIDRAVLTPYISIHTAFQLTDLETVWPQKTRGVGTPHINRVTQGDDFSLGISLNLVNPENSEFYYLYYANI